MWKNVQKSSALWEKDHGIKADKEENSAEEPHHVFQKDTKEATVTKNGDE